MSVDERSGTLQTAQTVLARAERTGLVTRHINGRMGVAHHAAVVQVVLHNGHLVHHVESAGYKVAHPQIGAAGGHIVEGCAVNVHGVAGIELVEGQCDLALAVDAAQGVVVAHPELVAAGVVGNVSYTEAGL